MEYISIVIRYRLHGQEGGWTVAGEYDSSKPGTVDECCRDILKRYVPQAEFMSAEVHRG